MNARGGMSDGIAVDLLELQSLLQFIQADGPRDEWFRVLAGIKDEFGENGKDMARDWSAQSDKFKPRDFESTWRSAQSGHVGIGTVIYLAKENGYIPVKKLRSLKKQIVPTKQTDEISKPIIQASSPRPITWDKAKILWARVEQNYRFRDDKYVASHPYAKKKCIECAAGAARHSVTLPNLWRDEDCIIVPYYAYPTDELIGVECIDAKGTKRTFGNKGLLP